MRYLVDFEEQIIIVPDEIEGEHAPKIKAAIRYFENQNFKVWTENEYTDKILFDISRHLDKQPISHPITHTYTISNTSIALMDLIDEQKKEPKK